MGKHNKVTVAFWTFLTVFPIIGLVLGAANPAAFEMYKQDAKSYADQLGIAAPIAFVGLQALQVVITPISHYVVGLIGGFLYGPYWGGALNWLGRVIGHFAAFYLARRYGRKMVDRFVPSDTVARFDRFVSGKEGAGTLQATILFLIFFLPLFPDDEISYIVGMSKMKFRLYFIANVLGQVGGAFSLAYLGSGVSTKDPIFWVLTISTLFAFPACWWAMKKHNADQNND